MGREHSIGLYDLFLVERNADCGCSRLLRRYWLIVRGGSRQYAAAPFMQAFFGAVVDAV